MSCHSEVGLGTTFRVYFPEVRDPLDEPSFHDLSPITGRGELVLLVEDDEQVRTVAHEMLASAGYGVLQAGDGEAALVLCDRHEGAIDLLLTDVVMPGMGGAALARAVLERRPGTKVLFMSGYSPDAQQLDGLSDSKAALLLKPFTLHELTCRVCDVLSGAPPRPQ